MLENGTGGADRTRSSEITRRRLLKRSAAVAGLAGGSGVLTGFPTIWAQDIKDVTLLHAGPPVAAIPKIGEQATKDLGFTIKMQATESADLLNRFLSQSSAIDVGDVSIVFMKYLVGRNVLAQLAARPGERAKVARAAVDAMHVCGISDLRFAPVTTLSTGQRRLVAHDDGA